MNMRKSLSGAAVCVAGIMLAGSAGLWAQNTAVRSRVVEAVDDTRTVRLQGNVHPLARPANDQGALADSQPMTRMLLLLQRSQEQEATLRQLLEDQQNKASANFHAWLTPEQFGKQFGPTDADVQAVTDWLTRQGFQVKKVGTGRTVIEFSGNVAQVRNAFHTEIHRFVVNGEEHFANVSDPAMPEALSPVVNGVMGLHNFRKRPFIHRVGKFRQDLTTGQILPLFTFNDVNGTFYGVGPADFATIYDIPSNYDGTGQSIAIVGQSNILIQDTRDFRTMFGLPANDPQIILNGPDPGLVSPDEAESDLDVEWAGAVAPAAKIILVTTLATETDGVDGIDASALYIVDNNVAPILSYSYGNCESNLGATGNAYYNALWQQAAAEGITVVVAAGDNGPAGCDNATTETSETGGIAVSGIASTPYNIAMGGTDFNQVGNQTTYWNTSSSNNNVYPSAKGYIPEMTWNQSCAGQSGGVNACASATTTTGLNISAGSGGPSAVYRKPTWQTGTGVPADGARDIPDISLFASDGGFEGNGKSFYIVCESDLDIPGDTGCNLTSRSANTPFHDFQGTGGTSAAAPTFAGIMALVNQKTGQRQGNANYVLYSLAARAPSAFHDITTGNISVPCTGSSTDDCSTTSSSSIGVMTTTNGGTTIAYTAGTGYDLATGLGSVDVTNLLNAWASPSLTATTTSLTGPSPSSITVDASVSVSGSVTKTSGTGAPTGVVVLENSSTGAAIDTFTLDGSGNYSGTTTMMPGGSYTVKAHYGGDGTSAPSDSNSTVVNVGSQSSKVIVSWVTFNGNTPVLSTSSQSVQYGSSYILRVDVANSSGVPCENFSTGVIAFVCPTGKIALFKNSGVPLNDFPTTNGTAANVANLNDRGFVEDQPIQLPVGTYNITATYSGDNSYNAQPTSNALGVTITQAATTTAVTSNLSSITPGESVMLTATVGTISSGDAPCGIANSGTVQFTNGGSAIAGTVTYTPVSGAASSTGAAFCTATLTTTISSLYPPPTGRPGTPAIPRVPLVVALLSLLLFVLGLRWIPQTRRRAYTYAGLLAIALLVGVVAGCGGGSGGGGGGGGSTRTIGASYGGDTNYSASAGTTTITVQ